MNSYSRAVLFAIIAALAASTLTPLSSLVLNDMGAMTSVGYMNLAIGIAVLLVYLLFHKNKNVCDPNRHLKKSDTLSIILMNAGDLLGSVLLMIGLTVTSASTASLMLNFEIVATALVAFVFLKEKISKPLLIAITLITLGCITISSGDMESFISSPGMLLILGACFCWGFTNCVKKKVAERNLTEILTIRGFSIGIAGIILGIICGEPIPDFTTMLAAGLVGLIAYGAANLFFMMSQRDLGAAKSGTIYGIYPFLSAVLSMILFQEAPTLSFAVAFLLLVPGFYLATVTREENALAEDANREALYARDDAEIGKPDSYFEARNYLTAIGFVIIAAHILMGVFLRIEKFFNMELLTTGTTEITAVCSLFLFIIGIILIILRKRDFAGITFIIISLVINLYPNVSVSPYLIVTLGIFCLLVGVLFLQERRKKRFIYSILFILLGLKLIMQPLELFNPVFPVIGFIAAGAFFFIALSATNLIPGLPTAKILVSDELFSFMRCGSMLGYLIIAFGISPWVSVYIFGTKVVALDIIHTISITCAVFLLIVAVLLLFIAKIKFTSVVFIGMAFILWIIPLANGLSNYIIGIVLLIFGLFSVCRKKSFLLVALMFILLGISAFSSVSISGITELAFTEILLHIIPCLISLYLAAAIFSPRKKLPLF